MNKVAHTLAKTVTFLASVHLFIDIQHVFNTLL
jgi:hypothetical protein